MTESSRNVLEVRGLTIRLPARADRPFAVENVSFDVAAGEIVCVVGESGSGKSVTAYSVLGLLPEALVPIAGEVRLQGENLLGRPQRELRRLRARRMAMIFQEPMTALNPVLTVGAQIEEVLEIHTALDAVERRAKAIAAMREVALPDPERLYHAYPHQLSGGQRQRVMIAMALILEPVLLVADEPTTALDVTTQAQILRLIRDLQRRHGTAVLFITHDFGVVAEIADRVVVMQEGQVVEQGPVQQVLFHPQHAYTRALIASVPSLNPPERPLVGKPAALIVRDLRKVFEERGWFGVRRRVEAVRGVSFEVRQGETVGVVGESGSGKSTLARCLVGLLEPSAGEVEIIGHHFRAGSRRFDRQLRRDVQIVFQDPYRSLNPRRTVGQSIVEGPMNFGVPKAEALARARELLRVVRMSPDVLDRYPHQFSGGQRQRLCIARALALAPRVLIADEAVSALDVSVQAQVLELLDEVKRRFDLALVFITHDLRVAASICDRILVMHRGEIVEQGPTHEVFRWPKHCYTQTLLKAAPGREVMFGVAGGS